MKKLLSIIGAISIAGSGASAVIACSNSKTGDPDEVNAKKERFEVALNKTDQDEANAVKQKIDNKVVTIQGNQSADASKYKTVIDAALKAATGLTDTELTYLSYSGSLEVDSQKTINVVIKVGVEASAQANIKVTLEKSPNQNKADALQKKIDGQIIHISGYDVVPDASKDKSTLDLTLKVYAGLDNSDLKYLSYSGRLVLGDDRLVTVTISVGTDGKATATIDVDWVSRMLQK